VEDIFTLDAAPFSGEQLHVVGPPGAEEQRLAAGFVRDRLVAYPLTGDRAVREGLIVPDAVQTEAGTEIVSSNERLGRTAILLGCDPSLGILGSHLGARSGLRLLWLPISSTAALQAVRDGEAHVAGTHLPDPGSNDFNHAAAEEALAATGGIVVTFAAWEQGLAVAPGNPKGIREIADLARPDVWFVNREAGSGSRALLDGLLAGIGIPAGSVKGYDSRAEGHFAVARAVRGGQADAGVCLRAVAHALGLDFVPLEQVRFDLVIPRDHLGHPTVAAALDLLTGRDVRHALRSLPGYEVSETGNVVATIAPKEAA
jgi:molybdate-binding protein